MRPAADPVLAEGPEEVSEVPASAGSAGMPSSWDGPTYYGRRQLKPAPFEAHVVGGYVFLAGLSGASALIAAVAEPGQGARAEALVRRGRYLALLAPTIGSGLLVYDLHTPTRFPNMFRVAKGTSPMSIGTWVLTGFSLTAGLSVTARLAAERGLAPALAGATARAAGIGSAFCGAGLATYTAALFAATATPAWAAAPRALAVRFGASAVATGAMALWLGERDGGIRRRLETLAALALAVEVAAGASQAASYRRAGIGAIARGPAGLAETILATGLGAAFPLGLYALSRLAGRPPTRRQGTLAALAVLAGGAALRIATIKSGAASAEQPEISLRFAQPDNLPRT